MPADASKSPKERTPPHFQERAEEVSSIAWQALRDALIYGEVLAKPLDIQKDTRFRAFQDMQTAHDAHLEPKSEPLNS